MWHSVQLLKPEKGLDKLYSPGICWLILGIMSWCSFTDDRGSWLMPLMVLEVSCTWLQGKEWFQCPALNSGDEALGWMTCSWSLPNYMIYYPFLQLFSQSSFFIFTISYSYLLFPQGSQFCWLFTPSFYSWCGYPGKFHLDQQFCKVMPLFIHSFSSLPFLILLSS